MILFFYTSYKQGIVDLGPVLCREESKIEAAWHENLHIFNEQYNQARLTNHSFLFFFNY